MIEVTRRVKETLKRYGDGAAAHFGITKGRLDGYMQRGKYPLGLIEKILAEAPYDSSSVLEEEPPQPPQQPEAQPPPAASAIPEAYMMQETPVVQATARRVEDIVKYIQGTIDVYIGQFARRIDVIEKQVAALRQGQLRAAGVPSLARPDQGVPVDQVFTTNPNAGLGSTVWDQKPGNALDTGIAPTKEQVDAQANMAIVEGVPVPGAQLARPAEYIPDQPGFGHGWNLPRPRK